MSGLTGRVKSSCCWPVAALCGAILTLLEPNAITFWINFLLIRWYVPYLLAYHLIVILLINWLKTRYWREY